MKLRDQNASQFFRIKLDTSGDIARSAHFRLRIAASIPNRTAVSTSQPSNKEDINAPARVSPAPLQLLTTEIWVAAKCLNLIPDPDLVANNTPRLPIVITRCADFSLIFNNKLIAGIFTDLKSSFKSTSRPSVMPSTPLHDAFAIAINSSSFGNATDKHRRNSSF
mmetsp:Transcript_8190/g.16662  ORF Transcript_8190/g.16662 Transcript_8190/m.16662 type:complete len:165 (+) Transcript_8190:2551-3045(+)